jgi:hypothetical protein
MSFGNGPSRHYLLVLPLPTDGELCGGGCLFRLDGSCTSAEGCDASSPVRLQDDAATRDILSSVGARRRE